METKTFRILHILLQNVLAVKGSGGPGTGRELIYNSILSSSAGTMRVFEAMTYTVYYCNTEDVYPSISWLVEGEVVGSRQQITVEMTDQSGVVRVAVGYT